MNDDSKKINVVNNTSVVLSTISKNMTQWDITFFYWYIARAGGNIVNRNCHHD